MADYFRHFRSGSYCGWLRKPLFVCSCRGIIIPGFLRWCWILSIHSRACACFTCKMWTSTAQECFAFCPCAGFNAPFSEQVPHKGLSHTRWLSCHRFLFATPRTSLPCFSFHFPLDFPLFSCSDSDLVDLVGFPLSLHHVLFADVPS